MAIIVSVYILQKLSIDIPTKKMDPLVVREMRFLRNTVVVRNGRIVSNWSLDLKCTIVNLSCIAVSQAGLFAARRGG